MPGEMRRWGYYLAGVGIVLSLAATGLLFVNRERIVWIESQGPTIENIHFTDVPALCEAFIGGRVVMVTQVASDSPPSPIFVSSTGRRSLLINRSSYETVSLVVPRATGDEPEVLDARLETASQRPSFTVQVHEDGVVSIDTGRDRRQARVAVRSLSCDDAILFGSEVSPNQLTVTATVSESLSAPPWLTSFMLTVGYILLATAFAGSLRGTEPS